MSRTQVHGLVRGVCCDAVEHDAGQHGAEQQCKAAGNPLDTSEGAARGAIDHRVPEVSVAEVLCGLHEEQVTEEQKGFEVKTIQTRSPFLF